MHYIYKFLSIFLTNVYKTSINTISTEMDFHNTPVAIKPITPRRVNGLSVPVSNGSYSAKMKESHLLPLPSTPIVYKNALMPLVEFEKLNDKLDSLTTIIMQEVGETSSVQVVGETEPLGPVQVESVPEALSTLIKTQHDETRHHIARENETTRKHVAWWAIVIILFIAVVFAFYLDFAVVCSTTPPVPPVCEPAPKCAGVEVSDLVCIRCIVMAGFQYARDRLNETINQK